MKYNTRMNPTISGELHCGHLYAALVNATEAHRSGGNFIIRIDDTQDYWKHKLGKKVVDQLCAEYHEQFSRFMTIDKWVRQSNMPSPREIVGDSHLILDFIPKPMWFHDIVAEWIPDPDMAMYPYAPAFTFEKVVWDFYDEVNWLIRGEDLITETSLYDFFVDVLGLPRMRQTYLPRLRARDRQELAMGISKSFRTYRLENQLIKYGTEAVLDFLKQSCLIDIEGEFFVENVKWNPTIVGFEA